MSEWYEERTDKILQDVLAIARREGKLSGFCIGNTTKVETEGLFFTPIRNTQRVVAGSVILYKDEHAQKIASLVDGNVDYIFVDTEKKTGYTSASADNPMGNIERVVRDVVRKTPILGYKGNDLTVDSIDCYLSQTIQDPIRGMGGKKATIIGAGNLGSKLALKLVERGVAVTLTRRNSEKLQTIVRALNFIKPEHTAAVVQGTTDNEAACQDANILIGLTEGTPVITASMINRLAKNAIVMDGGKGCIHPEALERARVCGLTVLRVDIRAGFEGEMAQLLEMERLLKETMGRREINGIPIVSGGFLGYENEIVVDNIHRPTTIYGIANGRGDFFRRPTPEQTQRVEAVRSWIKNQPPQGTGH